MNTLCEQLPRHINDSSYFAYDALYALSDPEMAREAVPILSARPGIEEIVELVIQQVRESNANAASNFAVLLAAFDADMVDPVLAHAAEVPETRQAAYDLQRSLAQRRGREVNRQVWIAGYASDTINVQKDPLDIREDVRTLTAVMLAREVKPPLAIGLFGGWEPARVISWSPCRRPSRR